MKNLLFLLMFSIFSNCCDSDKDNVVPQVPHEVNCETGSVPLFLETSFIIPQTTLNGQEVKKTLVLKYNYLNFLHEQGFTRDSIVSISLDTVSLKSGNIQEDCTHNGQEWECSKKITELPAIFNIKVFFKKGNDSVLVFEKYPPKGSLEIEFKSTLQENFKDLIQSNTALTMEVSYLLSTKPSKDHNVALKMGFCAKIKR